MRHVKAGSVELESDTHANTPFPWDELSLTRPVMDLASLLRLPDPAGGESGPRVVRCGELVLSKHKLIEVSLKHMTHTHMYIGVTLSLCV